MNEDYRDWNSHFSFIYFPDLPEDKFAYSCMTMNWHHDYRWLDQCSPTNHLLALSCTFFKFRENAICNLQKKVLTQPGWIGW